jgi:hypothetical protein
VRNLVFVDEAELNLSIVSLFARAINGERAISSVPEARVAMMTVPGSTNTEVFFIYLTQVLAPQL